jgi:transposase InsO family protein
METGYRMKQSSRKDYLQKIQMRYQQASRSERRRILDEFCANCSYHRKHAIRLLNGPPPGSRPRRARRPRGVSYGPLLIRILKAVWEAADYPWSVRLKALLPEWMPWIRRRFRLAAELERQLLAISPRSIDYRLAAHKRQQRRRLYGRTKPGVLLKHHIPIKTDRWDVQQPGFTEIDLVSHSGSSASGHFCHSLNLTDIYSTWTETRAVLGKSQKAVQQALDEMRQALPFALLGIDSDNGSEFINAHLHGYCRSSQVQFTRGRPYKKDDNAHIEQKNWTHVRRLLGYLRYDSPAALEAINDLYRNELRLFQNLFLPSVKLERKVRVGSRLRRRYTPPQTPWQRLCADKAATANPQPLQDLQRLRDTLDPFALAQRIRTKLDHIFELASQSNGHQAARSTASTNLHRLPQKEKSGKKERKNDDDEHVLLLSKKQKSTHLGLHSQIARRYA